MKYFKISILVFTLLINCTIVKSQEYLPLEKYNIDETTIGENSKEDAQAQEDKINIIKELNLSENELRGLFKYDITIDKSGHLKLSHDGIRKLLRFIFDHPKNKEFKEAQRKLKIPQKIKSRYHDWRYLTWGLGLILSGIAGAAGVLLANYAYAQNVTLPFMRSESSLKTLVGYLGTVVGVPLITYLGGVLVAISYDAIERQSSSRMNAINSHNREIDFQLNNLAKKIDHFLDHPEEINFASSPNQSPETLFVGFIKNVTEHIEQSLNEFSTQSDQKSLLMLALGSGNIPLAESLLQRDPQLLNKQDKQGRTAFYYAFGDGAEFLIKKGEDLHIKDHQQRHLIVQLLDGLGGNITFDQFKFLCNYLIKHHPQVIQDEHLNLLSSSLEKRMGIQLLISDGLIRDLLSLFQKNLIENLDSPEKLSQTRQRLENNFFSNGLRQAELEEVAVTILSAIEGKNLPPESLREIHLIFLRLNVLPKYISQIQEKKRELLIENKVTSLQEMVNNDTDNDIRPIDLKEFIASAFGLPPALSACEQQQQKVPQKDRCIVCLEGPEEYIQANSDNQKIELANCRHQYCSKDLQKVLKTLPFPWKCIEPSCKKFLRKEDLKSLYGLDQEQYKKKLLEYQQNTINAILAKQYGYLPCRTANCPDMFKPRPLLEKDPSYTTCKTCENSFCASCGILHPKHISCQQASQEDFHLNRLKHDPASNVRPCPFKNCYRPFAKNDACNHVTCPNCNGKWNFKSGRKDPSGGGWDLHDKGARTYRVPGDYSKKKKKFYTTYEENVTDD